MLTHIVRHIFRTASLTNFKLGIRKKDDDPHQPQHVRVQTERSFSCNAVIHGTLKHISAMSDSFGNCCAAANQKSAGRGVALRSPTLERYVRSSVFACISSSNHYHGMFSQINSWVTFSTFNLATLNTRHARKSSQQVDGSELCHCHLHFTHV